MPHGRRRLPEAASAAAVRPAAMLPLREESIADAGQVRLREPSELRRVELRIAMDAAVAFAVRLVEPEMRQHVASARDAARDRERGGLDRGHAPASKPSAASASRMRPGWSAGQ